MRKKETKEKGGLCCPHCADSKFPCVNMEKQMRKGVSEEPQAKEEDKR
jgi:hypothetical protein